MYMCTLDLKFMLEICLNEKGHIQTPSSNGLNALPPTYPTVYIAYGGYKSKV